ncbi:MAG: LuxR C-terminal-related transcriptional regulator [Patescibacteria group bacterium]
MRGSEHFTRADWERVEALKKNRTWDEVAAIVERPTTSLITSYSDFKKGKRKGQAEQSLERRETAFRMLRRGHNNNIIADTLGISPPAVSVHFRNMGLSAADVKLERKKVAVRRAVVSRLKSHRGLKRYE